jgi:hypothetical protein
MLENNGIACALMHGFNWEKWSGAPTHRFVTAALSIAPPT